MKQKIMLEHQTLGTSDTWLLSRLSQRPSNPVYYIEDCRISTALRAAPEQLSVPFNKLPKHR